MPAREYDAMKDHLTQSVMAAAHHVNAGVRVRDEDRATVLMGVRLVRAELDHLERHVRMNARPEEIEAANEHEITGRGDCPACQGGK